MQENDSGQPPGQASESRRGRRLRKLLVGFAVYVLLCLAYSFIPYSVPDPELTQLSMLKSEGVLVAGAGRADITPPRELWPELNTFGEAGPVTGIAAPIYVRTLALGSAGQDGRLLIASCELTIVTREMHQAVLDRLAGAGYQDLQLLLVATHTHSVPANYWRDWLGERICGPFNQAYLDHIVTQITQAATQALNHPEPVSVSAGASRTRLLVKHMARVDAGSGRRAYTDTRVEAMAFRRLDGTLMASLVSFPAHPLAMLHQSQGQIAADYPGELSLLIEAAHPGAVALFLPGALGGVRATSPGGTEGYRGRSGAFGKVAMQADLLYGYVSPLLQDRPATAPSAVRLGWATAAAGLPAADLHYFPESTPFTGVRFLTGPLSWLANRVLDAAFIPDEAVFQVVRIGDTVLLAVPGDLGSSVGIKLKRLLKTEHVWPLSHANGYDLGYVVDADEYDLGGIIKGGHERVMSFFGKSAGPFTIRALLSVADQIGVRQTRVQRDLP